MRVTFFSIFIFIHLFFFGCSSKKDPCKIALDPTWFPLDLANKEANMSAFSQELVEKIASRKGLNISLIVTGWESAFDRLEKKEFDGFLTFIEPYAFNLQTYRFSHPYFLLGPVVVLKETNKLYLENKLQEKEIAVFSNQDQQTLMDAYPKVLVRSYGSIPKALTDVTEEVIDGAFLSSILASSYITDIYHGHLEVFTKPFTSKGLRLITSAQSSPQLIDQFNKGLEELKASGEYEKLLIKWKLIN